MLKRKKSHGINPVTKGHYLFKLLIPCSPVESREGHHGTFLHCLIDGIGTMGRRDRPAGLTRNHVKIHLDSTVCRGEFSASPRVSTFLSTASRFQVTIQHVAGAAILPSDFASRNSPDCDDSTCQICTFVKRTEESVVRLTTAEDVLSGRTKLPFTSRNAWLSLQSECPDLRRTHSHLLQGTRPSKKLTHIRDVKRYLNVATIASDGLLVVKRDEPLEPTRQCIIIPRQVLDGVLTAIHLQLSHPTGNQLKKVMSRYFYALDLDKAIYRVTDGCHTCAALKHAPHTIKEQSTSDSPPIVGVTFAADILKRNRQLILVVRECVTSYTAALHVEDEKHNTLRDTLIRLCIEIRPLDGPHAVIRTDPAPAFKSLVNDATLHLTVPML